MLTLLPVNKWGKGWSEKARKKVCATFGIPVTVDQGIRMVFKGWSDGRIVFTGRDSVKGLPLKPVPGWSDFYYGNIRKYSDDCYNLVYKKQKFAESKAHAFYRSIFGNDAIFHGVINYHEYKGEVA